MQDVLKITEEKMKKAIEVLKRDFAAVRTGRASPALLDHVQVEYYGTKVPIKQLAGISVPEPRLIVIQPYDKNAAGDVEKAILKSDLGLTPMMESGVIRLAMPQPTEERRKELVKLVKKEAEEAKIALRNIRREAMDLLKGAKGKKELSEDQERIKGEEVGKLITRFTEEVEKHLKAKEAEIMEV